MCASLYIDGPVSRDALTNDVSIHMYVSLSLCKHVCGC